MSRMPGRGRTKSGLSVSARGCSGPDGDTNSEDLRRSARLWRRAGGELRKSTRSEAASVLVSCCCCSCTLEEEEEDLTGDATRPCVGDAADEGA